MVTDRMRLRERTGKVFVDRSQNDGGKSTVAPYSLRGGLAPTVSAPLTWREVEEIAGLVAVPELTPGAVLRRLEIRGDLFAPVLRRAQALP